MKLNLLPTYVSKEKQGRVFVFLAAALALGSIALAIFMVLSSRAARKDALLAANDAQAGAMAAVAQSKKADELIKKAGDVIRNANLAKAILAHSSAYPRMYDYIRDYIPPFYRVQTMQVAATDPTNAQVTLTGVLHTQQEYADLMLALWRIPGSSALTREGYEVVDRIIPNLTPEDRLGRPIKPGEPNVPDDGYERLQYYMSQGSAPSYLGVGGFGVEDVTAPKGAMPDWSVVTVTFNMPVPAEIGTLQAPDVRATLGSGGGAPAPGGGGFPGPGAGAGAPAPGGRGGARGGADSD